MGKKYWDSQVCIRRKRKKSCIALAIVYRFTTEKVPKCEQNCISEKYCRYRMSENKIEISCQKKSEYFSSNPNSTNSNSQPVKSEQ